MIKIHFNFAKIELHDLISFFYYLHTGLGDSLKTLRQTGLNVKHMTILHTIWNSLKKTLRLEWCDKICERAGAEMCQAHNSLS